MKVIVVILCLVVAVSSKDEEYKSHFQEQQETLQGMGHFFGKLKETVNEYRQSHDLKNKVRINPTKCLHDSSELASQRFHMCENFLTSFSPSNINITAANNFCHQDCARYLINLLNAVVKDCGIHPADMPTRLQQQEILEMCGMNPSNHKYCIEIWKTFSTPSMISRDYVTCLSQFNGQGPCPDVCKKAERWVQTAFNCCYWSIVQYSKQNRLTEGVLDGNEWILCGMKEPTQCVHH